MRYLVGIVEHKDDCSPIEQTNVITRMDRAPLKLNEEVVPGRNGLFGRQNLETSLPLDSNFVRP